MFSSPPAPAPALGPATSEAGGRITVEVDDELGEHLRHLARARALPLESLAGDLLRRGLEQETRRKQAEAALAGLTPRQREVARLAVGGRTNRQIARELWLSPETVKTHLRRALEHFDLHSKAELRLLLLDLDGDRAAHPEEDPLRDAPLGVPRGPLQDAPSGVRSATKRYAKTRRSATKREARLPGD